MAEQPEGTLEGLLREIPGARIERGDPKTLVRDVRHDSREVHPGDAFVARRGRQADGGAFVPQAVARGAALVIAESAPTDDVPWLRVPDAERALAIASSAVWHHPSFTLDVVGITGTNGKTTTTWLLEHALNALKIPTGVLGTVAHRFGSLHWPALHTTPEADDVARRSAAMRDAGATHVVMEVSSHALALQRVAAVRFRVAALTNVTQDHLDFHGSFERYAEAKRSLFLAYGPAASVLNVDDAVGLELSRTVPDAITYSARGADGATLRALTQRTSSGGIAAEVITPEGPVTVTSPLVGHHNLENLLTALGVLHALEIPMRDGVRVLADAVGAPGRLERVALAGRAGDEPDVFVDYAHSPDALTNVLRALRGACAGRLICVFGCGGDRDVSKRAPMGAAVAAGADLVVLTTDNPRTERPVDIAAQAERGLHTLARIDPEALERATHGYTVVLDRRAAIARAIEAAHPGDVVLIAGKGHEPYQEVHGVRTPFDDRDEARGALTTRRMRRAGAAR